MERPKVWSILSHGISINTSYRFRSSSSSTLAAALPLAGLRLLFPPTMATLPMQPYFFLNHAAPYTASSCGAPPGAVLYAALPDAGHASPLWRVFVRCSFPRHTLRGSSPRQLRCPQRGSYLRRPCRPLWRVVVRC
jgi:hypothetical protein